MIPVGRRGQTQNDDIWDFSSTIAMGGTAQIVVPQQPRRTFLQIENISNEILYFGLGPALAHATISGGKVTAVTVDNGGLGYSIPPVVEFLGGLVDGDYQSVPQAGYPFKPAQAVATISGGAVTAITVIDGGYGYLVAPRVYLYNGLPALGGGAMLPANGVGLALVPAGSATYDNGVPWSAVAVWGATLGSAFVCQVLIS